MKAVVATGLNELSLQEVPIPDCKDDEVLLRIDSCAICGSDLRIITSGNKRVQFPWIMGHEMSGTVVHAGSKTAIKEGTQLCFGADCPCGYCHWCRTGYSNNCENNIAFGHEIQGGFAEYIVISNRILKYGPVYEIPQPNNISQDEFALAEPVACCVNGIEAMKMNLGANVLIIGAGPIGVMLAKLSRLKGASNVVLADIDERRLTAARIAWADDYVLSTSANLIESSNKYTRGKGFDAIFTACPAPVAQQLAFEVIKPRGVINFFGGLPQHVKTLGIPTNKIHYKEITVLGTHGSTPRQLRIAAELIASRQINVKDLISKRISLDTLAPSFFELAQQKENMKIVVRPHE